MGQHLVDLRVNTTFLLKGLPVVLEPAIRAAQAAGRIALGGHLEIPPFVLRMCREQRQADGAGKAGIGELVRQPIDP